MTLEDFINRARDRGLTLELRRVGHYLSLEHDGQWVPVPGLHGGEDLGRDGTTYLCECLGLDPVDFDLDPAS